MLRWWGMGASPPIDHMFQYAFGIQAKLCVARKRIFRSCWRHWLFTNGVP
jgi:hypothetical protein